MPSEVSVAELETYAATVRPHIIEVATELCHAGGALSATDIIATLYVDVLNVDSKNQPPAGPNEPTVEEVT